MIFARLLPTLLVPSALVSQIATVTAVERAFSPRLAAGSLVTVVGTNLAGASGVQLGGKAAAVLTPASPTQIAIQLPVDLAPGPTTLVVRTSAGTSAPFPITLDAYAPTLRGAGSECKTGVDTFLEVIDEGLGSTDPPVATGETTSPASLARTLVTPSVTLDGVQTGVITSVLVTWFQESTR